MKWRTHVDAKEGNEASRGLKRVLIGARGDGELPVHFIVAQPSPT